MELLKIYNMVERGGDGLVMTKSVKIVITRNIDELTVYISLNSSLYIVRM